jgi:hypothetical protein
MVQRSLDRIQRWCSKCRMKLSPNKTKVLVFSRCPTHKRFPVTLYLFNTQLQISDEADFLGVRLSSTMMWQSQFENMSNIAWPRTNSIRKLAALHRGTNPDTLLRIYQVFVTPLFEYASVAIIPAADTHFRKLRNIQSSAIKSILSLPSYVFNQLAHNTAGLPLVKEHLQTFSKNRVNNMVKSSPLIKVAMEMHSNYMNNASHKFPLDIVLTS